MSSANNRSKSELLVVIPARGGSKGVARKCIRKLQGVPLLVRTIETALAANLPPSRIVVSTDDDEFATMAKEHGAEVPFLRPPELAEDNSSVVDALLHLLRQLDKSGEEVPDIIMLLQVTSPFTLPEDLSMVLSLLDEGADAVVSVCESEVRPEWIRHISSDGYLERITGVDSANHVPRQQLPKSYRLNGAIYLVRTKVLLESKTFLPEKSVAYCMPTLRSLDIDTEDDLLYAEFLTSHNQLT